MSGPIKLGLTIGGSFAVGDIGGDWLADALKLDGSHVWARRGVKLGLGVASYFLIAALLGD